MSFDQPGFFSLVGNDSTDPMVGRPDGPVGGRPHQRSLNLGGFDRRLPDNWKGVVRHEFLHALAFHHSHQNMRGPCQDAFRWEDDDGYVPTRDSRGQFIPDQAGRRPGIYTFLAGAPNFWPRAKVDHNLKTAENPRLTAGPFDQESVMLYRFPDLFDKTQPSRCAPSGDGINLSDGDKRGLNLLYPSIAEARLELSTRAQRALSEMSTRVNGDESGYEQRTLEVLGDLAGT